jgi:hypothetical protein
MQGIDPCVHQLHGGVFNSNDPDTTLDRARPVGDRNQEGEENTQHLHSTGDAYTLMLINISRLNLALTLPTNSSNYYLGSQMGYP